MRHCEEDCTSGAERGMSLCSWTRSSIDVGVVDGENRLKGRL
jgi:hypothetical protein